VAALLVEAYTEAGKLRQAQAARRAEEQCPQRRPAPLALPALPGLPRSGATALPQAGSV
jgi:hypothetical protein